MNKLRKSFFLIGTHLLFFCFGLATKTLMQKDFLCAEAVPVVTTKELKFTGVQLHQGAVLPMRMCEYANRFTLEFWLPNKQEYDHFKLRGKASDANFEYAGGEIE